MLACVSGCGHVGQGPLVAPESSKRPKVLSTAPAHKNLRRPQTAVPQNIPASAITTPPTQQHYVSAEAYFYFLKAEIAADAGACKRAVASFHQALSYDSESRFLYLESARCLLRQGEVSASIIEARRALELKTGDDEDPDNVQGQCEARLVLVEALARAQDNREARKILAPLLVKKPIDPRAAQWAVLLALRQDDEAGAQKIVQQFQQPAFAEVGSLLQLGQFVQEQGYATYAHTLFVLAVAQDPRSEDALRLLRDNADQLGLLLPAIRSGKLLLDLGPEHLADHLALLRMCGKMRSTMARGQWTDYCRTLPNMLHRDLGKGRDPELRLAFAHALFVGGDDKLAWQTLTRQWPRRGPLAAPQAQLGSAILARQGELNKALAVLSRAKAQGSQRSLFVRQRAQLLWRQLRFDQAEQVLQKALQAQPQDSDVALDLIDFLARRGAPDKALQVLKTSAQQAPQATNWSYVRAQLLADQGHAKQALDLCRQALRSKPDDVNALMRLAMIAMRAQVPEQGEGAARQVLAIYPDHPAALNFLAYLWAQQRRDLPQAMAYAQRALRQAPDDPAILDTLGWVQLRSGKISEAAQSLIRAAALRPDDPEVLLHLGDLAAAQEKPRLARRHWRRGLAILPREKALRNELAVRLSSMEAKAR